MPCGINVSLRRYKIPSPDRRGFYTPKPLNQAVESSVVQTEGLSRNCAVALGRIERGTDARRSDAIEMGLQRVVGLSRYLCFGRGLDSPVERECIGSKNFSSAHHDRSLDHVFPLPHIARPGA